MGLIDLTYANVINYLVDSRFFVIILPELGNPTEENLQKIPVSIFATGIFLG
jgi:hypothetical protein